MNYITIFNKIAILYQIFETSVCSKTVHSVHQACPGIHFSSKIIAIPAVLHLVMNKVKHMDFPLRPLGSYSIYNIEQALPSVHTLTGKHCQF